MKRIKLTALIATFVLIVQMLCVGISASTNETEIEYYGRDVLSKMSNSTALLYAYDNIVQGIENSLDEISVYNGENAISVDEIIMVYDVYRRDHVEHFWVGTGYRYLNNGETVTALSVDYLYSGQELATKKLEFEAAVEEILSGMDSTASEFEKELYLHDVLAEQIVYIEDANAHNSYGALVEGRAVCEGYAESFQYLLQRAGIMSFIAVGASVNPSTQQPEGHGWNYVKIDGKYYHVDLTWDDQTNHTYHAYFNLTDSEITVDHEIERGDFSLPVCDSDDAMYFNVKGGVITDPSVEEIGQALKDNALSAGFYVKGDKNEFTSWLRNNISDIARYTEAEGLISYHYSILGDEVFMVFESCLHETLTKVAKKEATCTIGGNVEYYTCECGSWFFDENGTSPVSKEQDVYTMARGHDYSKKTEDAEHLRDEGSCQSKVTYWYDCSVCGVCARDNVAASNSFFEADRYGDHDFSSDIYEKDGEYFRKCIVKGCTQTEKADKEDYTGAVSNEREDVLTSAKEPDKSSVVTSSNNIVGCGSSVGAISAAVVLCAVFGAAMMEKRRK